MPAKTKHSNRVTLDDVAREAGVSAITVSRCIRAPEKVAAPSRLRIQAAIDRLGYVPHMAASALASRRTNVLGLIVPSVTNSVFSDVLLGVYDAIEATGLSVQIANSRYSPSEEETLIRTFLAQRPAGLIVSGVDQTPTGRALLEAADCPVVQIMDVTDNPIDMLVGFSHFDSAASVVRHFMEQGYRRPAILSARMDPRSQVRVSGFRREAERLGIFDPRRVVTTQGRSSVGTGCQLFADLMARAPDADCVFCNNDDLALGVLFEAARRNIRVPEALGVCGFNDLEISAYVNPPLTTVATPRYRTGQEAVRLVAAALGPGVEEAERHLRLEAKLVVRASSQPGWTGPTAT
ncbi:LacI family DNA-binding transcriptional regulator [Tropicimonas sediminicola]|uniref:Transcriptional regulator, LacI family n=1 Tax=Tropicimonas sediminicola TaxID=1031541 RepID=A0A239CZS2_9RHOB|nr:LacI family DNA-binding transcriptional regulator [Tropicimonas sediminicola]SNS24843.1 transcriptional regulator, LacI family [Tropicimonas sediminicola]